MSDLVCKIKLKSKDQFNKFKTLPIQKYGFLILNDFNIDFQELVSGLEIMTKTLKISQNNNCITFIPKLSHKNFHYSKLIKNPNEILWRNFDVDYEELQIKDMFLDDENIYYIKAIKLGGKFKVNQVKDHVKDDELSFLNSSFVNSKMISYRKMQCNICRLYDKEQDLFDICDCTHLVHQKCFQQQYKNRTVIEENQNYVKMTINYYSCLKCKRRFESKLKSLFNQHE